MKHLFCISILLLSAAGIHAQKQIALNGSDAKMATCNHPKFKNKEIIDQCSTGHSCQKWVITKNKQNAVKFNVGTDCPGLYNFALGPCRYIVYKQNGSSGGYEVYNKVDDFSCNKNTGVVISKSYFSNNTNFVILLYETTPGTVHNTIYWSGSGGGTYWSSPGTTYINNVGLSDTWKLTTLNFQGTSCVKPIDKPIEINNPSSTQGSSKQ